MNAPEKKPRLVRPDMEDTSKVNVTYEGETRAKFRTLIRSTVDEVWHEITRTDRPIPAFFDSRLDAERMAPGAKIAMRTPDGKYTGFVGRITEFDPPRRFAHTFRFTSYDEPEVVVAYDLEEVEGGVQFTMTLIDLVPGSKTAKQMANGAKFILGVLKSCMEDGRPKLGVRVLYKLFGLLAFMQPKRCLSTNWPIEKSGVTP
ncbi:MAG: SRPBCC domain-containing protein [Planctomycetota bacterium]